MSTQSKGVNPSKYSSGDIVFINREEAVFLGSWNNKCWYSFTNEDKVRYIHRSNFKDKVS